MVEILTKPKNALVKQYQYLLNLDGVKLSFEDEALLSIAREALKRNTGARGLRSIIEELMKNVMYEIPSLEGVESCLVTKETIEEKKDPVLTYVEKTVTKHEASA